MTFSHVRSGQESGNTSLPCLEQTDDSLDIQFVDESGLKVEKASGDSNDNPSCSSPPLRYLYIQTQVGQSVLTP